MRTSLIVALAVLAGCGASRNGATTMKPPANPVTWFSIPSDDVDAASRFYERAFGWNMQPTTQEPDPAFDYRVALSSPSNDQYEPRERGRVNGCIVKRATGVTTPAVLVEVDDLDAATKRVVDAGGTVASRVQPMRSLGGAFVLVRDPDGNLLELFRSNAR